LIVLLPWQLFQTFLDGVLTTSRIWRHGTPGARDEAALDTAVESLIASMTKLSERIKFCPLFPKAHELRHITRDFMFFGPACWTSTETFELKHKEVKKYYKRLWTRQRLRGTPLLLYLLRVDVSRFSVWFWRWIAVWYYLSIDLACVGCLIRSISAL